MDIISSDSLTSKKPLANTTNLELSYSPTSGFCYTGFRVRESISSRDIDTASGRVKGDVGLVGLIWYV